MGSSYSQYHVHTIVTHERMAPKHGLGQGTKVTEKKDFCNCKLHERDHITDLYTEEGSLGLMDDPRLGVFLLILGTGISLLWHARR